MALVDALGTSTLDFTAGVVLSPFNVAAVVAIVIADLGLVIAASLVGIVVAAAEDQLLLLAGIFCYF